MRQEDWDAVLEGFPDVCHAFAYGSAVFEQPGLYGKEQSAPLLDFMMVVADPLQWHAQNIERNRHHYSCLASLGPHAVAANAERLGVGVHFNNRVPWRDKMLKYGVIGRVALLDDLATWRALYVAGRLHKPVQPLRGAGELIAANEPNLQAAMGAALLLLPPAFGLRDLLREVCALSYRGDVRMGLAEDPRKVERILAGSGAALGALYGPVLQGMTTDSGGLRQLDAQAWEQDCSPSMCRQRIARLPEVCPSFVGVLQRLARLVNVPYAQGRATAPSAQCPASRVAAAVAASGCHAPLLAAALSSTVRASSARQAAAGLLMAGVPRSAAYVWQKVLKAWRRRSV